MDETKMRTDLNTRVSTLFQFFQS